MKIVHKIDDFLSILFPNIIITGGGKIDHVINELELYYTYGPYKPIVTISGDWVTIDIDTPAIVSQETDYRKTVALCEKGKYREAKQILENLIDKNPSNSEYHRIMGQILSEEGNQDGAINCLIDALRWDSKNSWAMLMMGNIFAKYKNDVPTAMVYYDQALVANVNDYISFTNIGYLLIQQGKPAEANRYLNAALSINPKYPNVHLALAISHEMNNDHTAAFDCSLHGLLFCTKKDELYQKAVQQTFKIANHIIAGDSGRKLLNNFKHQLEFEGDTLIEVIEDSQIQTPAKIEFAENFERAKHVVRFKPDYPAVEHLAMHELCHLKLVIEARKEGINQLFVASGQQKSAFKKAYQLHIQKLQQKGWDETVISKFMISLFDGINLQAYNTPIDLFIENDLYNQYESLRPFQFISLFGLITEGIKAVTNSKILEVAPKDILSKSKVYNLVNALQYRDLFGIDLLRDFKATPAELKQSETFYKEFLEYRDNREPAEEYEMVQHWAEDLKQNDWFELVGEIQYRRRNNLDTFLQTLENDPLGLEERDPVKEREMRKFQKKHELADVNMAVVMHIVSALNYFAEMTTEEVKKIAYDMAMQGTQGFDPNKNGYTVPTIPEKEFTGYQMMAWFYTSWAITKPDQVNELGLPFEKEWKLANEMTSKQ